MTGIAKFVSALAITLCAALPATADASCPWAEGTELEVRTTMTEVYVNGDRYLVKNGNRHTFASILSECDMPNALYSFNRWRDNRRTVNISAVVGLLVVWPALGWTIGDAAGAPRHKNNFERAMADWN